MSMKCTLEKLCFLKKDIFFSRENLQNFLVFFSKKNWGEKSRFQLVLLNGNSLLVDPNQMQLFSQST